MGIGNDFIGDVERMVVNDVIESRNLFRYSSDLGRPYTYTFETQIAEMYGVSGALAFPSATMALKSYLKTLNLGDDAEVIVSPFSWVSDYSALLFEGVTMRFCRLDDQLQVTYQSIERLINENTEVVMIPHLMGRGQQCIDQVADLCRKEDVVLIEDIAQSFGVKVKGKYAGTYGDFAFCSLNHHKLLSTGDGGFGIYQDREQYEEACQIHDQGCLIGSDGNRSVNESVYRKGWSQRTNNLTGGVALAQLARFPLVKHLIVEKQREFLELLPDNVDFVIDVNSGDIPFTALLQRRPEAEYPSLLESGWHFIENIPYYDSIDSQEQDEQNVRHCREVLKSTYAVGTGFIDKYYAIADGTELDEEFDESAFKNLQEITT